VLTLGRLGLPPPRSSGAHWWIGFLRTLPTAQYQLYSHRLAPMSCGQRRQQAARDRLGTVAGQGCSSATADVQIGNGHRAVGAKVITEQLGVGIGDSFNATLQDGKIILEPSKAEELTLEQILEGITPETYQTAEDQEWMNMRPVGKELL